jgi:hypothetical protein
MKKKDEIISTIENFPDPIDLNYIINNLIYKDIIEQGLKEIDSREVIHASTILRNSNDNEIENFYGCNWTKSTYDVRDLIQNDEKEICNKITSILLGQRTNEKESEVLANLHIDDKELHVINSLLFYIIVKIIHKKPYIVAIIDNFVFPIEGNEKADIISTISKFPDNIELTEVISKLSIQ